MIKHMLRTVLWLIFMSVVSVNFLQLSAQDTTGWSHNFTPRFRNLRAAEFLNNNTWVVVGGNKSNDAISTILTSKDSGATWNLELDNINAILMDLSFPSSQVGYAVGWSGSIYKTTDAANNWVKLTLPGNLTSRNYNGCYFWSDTEGIVVGGNEANDAIQTIIKTSDGGQSWNIVKDNIGPWLHQVEFISPSIGYASGDNGTLLKSTDGGNSWSALSVPGNLQSRHLSDIYLFDANTVVAVGGRLRNDSIQTIVKTTDGGANWSIVTDKVASMLHAVEFHAASTGFAVGNDGVVLKSTDQGSTWQEFQIFENQGYHLYGIHFDNIYYGKLVGGSGSVLTYLYDNLGPVSAQLNSPVEVKSNGAVNFTGVVNDGGAVAQLVLEYGNSLSFGSESSVNPANTLGNAQDQNIDASVQGLGPDGYYYARLRVSSDLGVKYSSPVKFYVGNNEIPNWSFEFWDQLTKDQLQDWQNEGSVRKVTSFNGSFACQLGGLTEGDFGAILYGTPDEQGLKGGIPFSDRPTEISFDASYDIVNGDAALVILQLKKGGQVIAENMEQITGTSDWEKITYQINYSSQDSPDSLILAFASSNVFGGSPTPVSSIKIDNVQFNGTQQVPNADMEDWGQISRNKADFWVSGDDERPTQPYTIEKSTDAYAGDFAVKLVNRTTGPDPEFARIATGINLFNDNPAFSISQDYKRLHVFIKGQMQGDDSLRVTISTFKNGQREGFVFEHLDNLSASEYKVYSVDIQSFQGVVPDSCYISFFISNFSGGAPSNSWALIDHMRFDGEASSIKNLETESFLLYPNPSTGKLFIKGNSGIKMIRVYDVAGKILMEYKPQQKAQNCSIDLSPLNKNLVIVSIESAQAISNHKIIIR